MNDLYCLSVLYNTKTHFVLDVFKIVSNKAKYNALLSVQEVVTHSLFGHTVKGDLEQFFNTKYTNLQYIES